MTPLKPTNVAQLVNELGAGIFEQKLAITLSDVALAVLEHQKPGEVSIKLKLKPAGSGAQVSIDHNLMFKKPKARGSISEDDPQESILVVNEGGNISQFPENQFDLFNSAESKPGAPAGGSSSSTDHLSTGD